MTVRLANHDPTAGQLNESIRAATFCIERAVSLSDDGYMTVLWDHRGEPPR
jgi:hypothetical protein